MYVTNLKSCSVATQTTGTESRQTAFVCDFCQWILLVHKLREGIGAEICIDDGRYCLGIYQVYRGKYLVITNIHTFADSPCHTSQTYSKLSIELFADSTYAAVAQMVYVVYYYLAVY